MDFLTLSETHSWSAKEVRKQFGGKALGLWEARKLGILIPETWLISAKLYETYCKKYPDLSSASKFLKECLSKELEKLPPTLFAVRSSYQFEDSAEHSFAGIFDSKLNVAKENLIEGVIQVWDSCHSFRANSYQESLGDFSMAVLIQPMVPSKYAGVCFSKHPSPSTVFENQHIVVEFAPSSGEKIVQGEITPFRLSGTSGDLAAATDSIWISPLLSAVQILKNFHHHEVDIEFAIDQKETFILVQQRPVSRVHASHIVDLSDYERKYKRSLLSFDIELLIEGCSKFLAAYLEIPFQLDRWMIMITSADGQQELWLHRLLNEAVIFKISQKIEEDSAYLQRIEARYQYHHQSILKKDYETFFDRTSALEKRFFEWCEFIMPFLAHYYVPMFLIDALHLLLKNHCEKVDPEKAASDLFLMGTEGISSLMDLLQEELCEFADPSLVWEDLGSREKERLQSFSERYGFLRCHQIYEEGYSAKDLFLLAKNSPSKKKTASQNLSRCTDKYFHTKEMKDLFETFRNWMRIRNQDMEYVLYGIVKSRKLFQEIAENLLVPIKDLWDSSREMISKAIQKNSPEFLYRVAHENLIIYRSYGKTRLSDHLHVLKSATKGGSLRGKTVWGEGKIEGKVHIAFRPQELESFSPEEGNNILVTGMTTPDFLPYLKNRFKALITDEGGILCHAAIVAREISIPCLVGTSVATEILKKGQRILIDFDRGEISLL